MAHSFGSMFKDGQQYMQTWPCEKQLTTLFPEVRVIAATRLCMKLMPPLAVLSVAAIVNQQGAEFLPQALAMGAFFMSLPMQGLLWLGHRANQLLPPALSSWYFEIHRNMQLQGCALQSPAAKPKYMELARLLKTAFDELDKAFTKRWF